MIDFRRYALGVCVAMVAGCGAHTGNGAVPDGDVSGSSLPHHRPFYYTGGAQYFTVPEGVVHITVVARGAHGAGSPMTDGGRVHADIPVTPGEKLVVYVGGDASGENGGFNGGASGGSALYEGKGGGGATDVREGGTSLHDRVLVSGGGGGQGGGDSPYSGIGGKGGDRTGGSGGCAYYGYREGSECSHFGGYGGAGGTQSAGGPGGGGGDCFTVYGAPGEAGALAIGGKGGGPGSGYDTVGGGGGGGGYYGGGGGGSGCTYASTAGGAGGGGGGGSSYVERKASNVRMWQGWKNRTRNGLVVISW